MLRGTLCHTVLEILIKPKNKSKVEKIIEENSITAVKSVYRLVRKLAKQIKLGEEGIDEICAMIVVGLNADFYCKGFKDIGVEVPFEIDGPNYTLIGFKDKVAIRKGSSRVYDYKTSKKKFKEEELGSNYQVLTYSLAVYKKHGTIPKVCFVFLRWPKQPMVGAPVCTPIQLEGFESFVEMISNDMQKFTVDDAGKRFAKDKDLGMCLYMCSYKEPTEYYSVIKADGKTYNTLDKSSIKREPGDKVSRIKYAGCPAWKNYLAC